MVFINTSLLEWSLLSIYSIPDFIRAEDWPSSNPDLIRTRRPTSVYPLDCNLRSVLGSIACFKRNVNLEFLKQSVWIALETPDSKLTLHFCTLFMGKFFTDIVWLSVKDFPIERVHAAIDNWPQHLNDCIASNGDHFE